jgi:uncharacterized membrane protein YbhN (UPF0104 family)
MLLLAKEAGVPVGDVVLAGVGGRHELALLMLRVPGGVSLGELDPSAVTDELLDAAWSSLARLHGGRLSHGQVRPENMVRRDDGTIALVDFAHASSVAPRERCLLDDVALLTTSSTSVGAERGLAAARRALGDEGLADLLPLLEPAALPPGIRRTPAGDKKILAELRTQGSALLGVETVPLVKIRRVTVADLLLAAGTIVGVYLLVGELAQVDYSTVFDDAQWGWVAVAFLLSPLPQLTGAISLKGAVAAPLPTGPVVAEQFANNFTGLVGGTLATTALVIRFFQRQGQKVAVAASSGVVNSLAGFAVQAFLVVVGLSVTGSEFTIQRSGGRDVAGIAILVVIVAGVLLGVLISVPRLRRWAKLAVGPQLRAGRDNLRGILLTPRKAVMLFGGNLASQLLFALAIQATLHGYGESLPLLQIVVINSFASFIGGAAPVPGGMGVIEAGLIAGFTAAGVPDSAAVATTFTYRTFTAYLPPIWGWFALAWLRRHEYV